MLYSTHLPMISVMHARALGWPLLLRSVPWCLSFPESLLMFGLWLSLVWRRFSLLEEKDSEFSCYTSPKQIIRHWLVTNTHWDDVRCLVLDWPTSKVRHPVLPTPTYNMSQCAMLMVRKYLTSQTGHQSIEAEETSSTMIPVARMWSQTTKGIRPLLWRFGEQKVNDIHWSACRHTAYLPVLHIWWCTARCTSPIKTLLILDWDLHLWTPVHHPLHNCEGFKATFEASSTTHTFWSGHWVSPSVYFQIFGRS